MVMADDDNGNGGRQQQRTTTAREIGWRTTRGKEESGQQTTTALEPAGKRARKNKEIKFMQIDFFQQYGLSSWIFCSRQNTQC
jgi:hypothetical protein